MNRGAATILLVVDDDASLLDVVQVVLEGEGYGVLKALNGEEALRVARAHPGPIALLLADVIMPGLSGPEVAARLHAIQPSMKVLYMSGFATEYVQARGLREGDPLLVKPFSPETLLSKVRVMLAYRSPFARRPEQPSR